MDMEFGCIAQRLGHSWSREIHACIADYDYALRELTPDEVGPFLEARAFRGVNVTIPYKQAVMPYLDVIDPAAAAIGAVNTIVNRGGRLYGYNTDFAGMKALLTRHTMKLKDSFTAILGTGGTSLTARAVALDAGAARVVRVSRHPAADDCISYADLSALAGQVDFIINTTPVGMFPAAGGMAVDPAGFPHLAGVIDAVYNPPRTDFVLAAAARGIPAACGLYMLVAQAAQAAALFLDDPSLIDKTDAVYRRIAAEKMNLVLIGMPGSGKTTLGRILADKLGKPFIDTDERLAADFGMPVGSFIDRNGISAFRAAESAYIRSLPPAGGAVIATGGGAVLDAGSVRALARGGLIVFLDRPLAGLTPTPDRPLSRTPDALARLYAERLPLYRAAADVTLPVTGTPAGCAERLIQIIEESL